jgi:LysM repeat protein
MMKRKFFYLCLFLLITPGIFAETASFSPAFLGIYRKTMEIEDEILKHSVQYEVDVQLSRAICLYESGGNANLTSWAGARGYFQVMPKTFRSLKVKTNIEAGIKYFSIQLRKYNREDYALAAYNGGPLYVEQNRPFRLETLQYVIGVGHFRSVLRLHEPEIRPHASRLKIYRVREGDDWLDISLATGIPIIELRMHNPFLSHRETLKPGWLVAYPPAPTPGLFERESGGIRYTTRIGDNYLHLVFVFDVNLDRFREENQIWRLQSLLAGTTLAFRFEEPKKAETYRVAQGDDIRSLAKKFQLTPWDIIHTNHLWHQTLQAGETIRLARIKNTPPPDQSKPKFFYYRIKRGDTLYRIAKKFHTTVGAIQRANNMGRTTRIRAGKTLKIPLG